VLGLLARDGAVLLARDGADPLCGLSQVVAVAAAAAAATTSLAVRSLAQPRAVSNHSVG
jgi:hypothetical protein